MFPKFEDNHNPDVTLHHEHTIPTQLWKYIIPM